jgi:pimeloyl-ACP methyl ester carboxylesterase
MWTAVVVVARLRHHDMERAAAGEGAIRMHVEVNGTRLWFDVDGAALAPSGPAMRQRPTVLLLHGGPGSYDHSYFKPDHARLASVAQVVYLDMRGHGRSTWGNPADWSFEICADDVRAFCDTVGIASPVVYGHSMGGLVAMLYGARHPGHAAALVLQSTLARFDQPRLVEGFRRFGGDSVAELAERDYGGDPVSDDEWARIFAVFGPHVPETQELARRIRNPELGEPGMELFRRFNVVDQLRYDLKLWIGDLHEGAAYLPH